MLNEITTTNPAEIYAILYYRQLGRRPLTNSEIDLLNDYIDYSNEDVEGNND